MQVFKFPNGMLCHGCAYAMPPIRATPEEILSMLKGFHEGQTGTFVEAKIKNGDVMEVKTNANS